VQREGANIHLSTPRIGFLSPQQDNAFESQAFQGEKKKKTSEFIKLP
jgi:hypothetical protein